MYLPKHGSGSETSISVQLTCPASSCSETDHKIPVCKLEAIPICTNSEVTISNFPI